MPSDSKIRIEEKVATALVTILQEVAADIGIDADQIRQGIWGQVLEKPCVVCAVGAYEERIFNSGVYNAECVVAVHSMAPDMTPEEHHRRVGVILDRLRVTEIITDLSDAVEDFHVYELKFMQAETEFGDNSWTHKQALLIVCMASDREDVAGEPTS